MVKLKKAGNRMYTIIPVQQSTVQVYSVHWCTVCTLSPVLRLTRGYGRPVVELNAGNSLQSKEELGSGDIYRFSVYKM